MCCFFFGGGRGSVAIFIKFTISVNSMSLNFPSRGGGSRSPFLDPGLGRNLCDQVIKGWAPIISLDTQTDYHDRANTNSLSR